MDRREEIELEKDKAYIELDELDSQIVRLERLRDKVRERIWTLEDELNPMPKTLQ